MKHVVKLAFFQDDATGDFGTAHENAIDCNNPFNAFWDATGIFHDVFEHYFEGKHKYFLDDNSFNVGGEIAAMGHLYYYINTFCFSPRSYISDRYMDITNIVATTQGFIEESITDGYCHYGYTLNCGVPYQKYIDGGLETVIEEHIDKLKSVRIRTNYEQEKEDAKNYKKSVSKSKLQRLYRWGYKQAAKLVPDNSQNYDELERFWNLITSLTTNYQAEEMYNSFKNLIVTITKKKGIIKIKTQLQTHDNSVVSVERFANEGFEMFYELEENY